MQQQENFDLLIGEDRKSGYSGWYLAWQQNQWYRTEIYAKVYHFWGEANERKKVCTLTQTLSQDTVLFLQEGKNHATWYSELAVESLFLINQSNVQILKWLVELSAETFQMNSISMAVSFFKDVKFQQPHIKHTLPEYSLQWINGLYQGVSKLFHVGSYLFHVSPFHLGPFVLNILSLMLSWRVTAFREML